ncbi:uncharacterized protein PITG_16928 [Phytophthora infestans T30-4]|uniref:Uncharacterized protein n=1 Tax=Phytophthora infestans (strain T30-4) TaxID=403677 RepID=D0NUF2_PHYIT|nr:uncharacterized protein PITG_16928 [Phytophthora infestans T30-4]EEY65285.1 conserved hypothetical protein [Phytophthora infestans T30-4]|eukprot:XP_002897349.1 conserved hypothetical protein [Phytophthora infestans T30-4]
MEPATLKWTAPACLESTAPDDFSIARNGSSRSAAFSTASNASSMITETTFGSTSGAGESQGGAGAETSSKTGSTTSGTAGVASSSSTASSTSGSSSAAAGDSSSGGSDMSVVFAIIGAAIGVIAVAVIFLTLVRRSKAASEDEDDEMPNATPAFAKSQGPHSTTGSAMQ